MSKKISKAKAAYRAHVVAHKRCGTCSMFRKPNSCTLVEGDISPQGVCKHWERKS